MGWALHLDAGDRVRVWGMATELTDRAGLAKDAYVYGYPLVFNVDQVRRYVNEGVGANPAAAFNTF